MDRQKQVLKDIDSPIIIIASGSIVTMTDDMRHFSDWAFFSFSKSN